MNVQPGRAIASYPAIALCSTPQLRIVLLTLNVPLGTVPLSAPYDDSDSQISPASTLNRPYSWARQPIN
ncbi:hypothetical protein [Oscillatoria acuminata]|uniref:hypothetical protein n=1 Tax=Oscillatoria acuminata TaxID=118323 RepID=UPI0002D673C8|nr:hypothetical protein [Oscillatoria acuminata]